MRLPSAAHEHDVRQLSNTAMMKSTLAIRWNDSEAKGYVDLFAATTFAKVGKQAALTHEVQGPKRGTHLAKCRVSVSATRADLDYEAFAAFNKQHGMYLGVLRLHFADADRTSVLRAEWRGVGEQNFAEAVVHEVEYKLKPLAPYAPGSATSGKVARQVRERPGQAQFRSQLKMAYGGRCCVTGCGVSASLEAAHIDPYLGPDFDHPQNGLLLRRDLHALFDAGLLAVEPVSLLVTFAEAALDWPEYRQLHQRAIMQPAPPNTSYRPSAIALKRRWLKFSGNQSAKLPNKALKGTREPSALRSIIITRAP